MPLKLINLISQLYYGTESVVRCGVSISDLFPVATGVYKGCRVAPVHFSAFMDWIMGWISVRSSCNALLENVKISDLDFADDEVIIAETLDILTGPSRC